MNIEEEKKNNNQRLQQLFADGKDWDPDRMFMSANDLAEWITQDKIKKQEDIDKVIDILVYQLDYKQTEIQGNAIRCLSKIMPKLNFDQTKKVSEIMINKVILKVQEFRDVYATCIKSLVNEVPHDYFEAIKPVLEISIKEIYKQDHFKDKEEMNTSLSIKEELLDIIQCILKRWSVYFKNSQFNKKQLIESLLNNIIFQERQSMRRKSSNTLGAITMVLNLEDIRSIIKKLIDEINKYQHKIKDIKTQIMYLVQALDGICKSISTNLDQNITSSIISLATSDIKYYLKYFSSKQDQDFDEIVNVSQVMELYLKILAQLSQCCPAFIVQYQNEIEELGSQCVEFDPQQQFIENDSNEQMDIEEEFPQEEQDDDIPDDLSWRVRKAGIQLIETLLKTKTEMVRQIYEKHFFLKHGQSGYLIKHLGENNENIRSAIIQIIQVLVKTITTKEHVQSHELNETDYVFTSSIEEKQIIKSSVKSLDVNQVIQNIMNQIKKILGNPKSSNNLKIQIFQLIESLVRNVNRYILEDPACFKITFEQIQYAIDSKFDNELQLSGLVCLKYLFKISQSSKQVLKHIRNDIIVIFSKMQKIIQTADFYRTISESFKVLNVLFYIIDKGEGLKEQIGDFQENIKQIIPIILTKLKSNDLDLEIKQSIILCSSSLIINLGKFLKNEEKQQILQSMYDKLLVETKKITILKLLQRLPIDLFQNMDEKFQELINSIIKEIIQYTQRTDRNQKLASLEAIDNLIKLQNQYHQIFDDNVKGNILQNLCNQINSNDIFISQLCLSIIYQVMQTTQTQFKEYVEIQKKCIELILSQHNITQNFSTIFQINKILVNLNILKIEQFVEDLTSKCKKECIYSIASTISNLVVELPQPRINQFLEQFQKLAFNQSQQDQSYTRQLCLIIISEYGKIKVLDDFDRIFSQILGILQNKNEKTEDIKYYASQCLGGISQGHLEKSIKLILNILQNYNESQQNTELYFYINALKEIIQNTKPPLLIKYSQDIFQILIKKAESNEESIKNIISECIGKLCVDNLSTFKPKILDLIQAQSINLKYVIISAIKFFFVKGAEVTPDQKEIVMKFQSYLGDKDLTVRLAALKTFGMIAYNSLSYISDIIEKKEFFATLCISLRQIQIREIELGPFKHKIDDAGYIRAQAFQMIDLIISQSNKFEQYEAEIIQEILNNFNNEIQDEIKILRFQILAKISQRAPVKMIPFLKQIVAEFAKTVDTILKIKEQDRPQDTIRSLLNTCYIINQFVDIEKNEIFNDWVAFYNSKLIVNPQFKAIIESFSQIQ